MSDVLIFQMPNFKRTYKKLHNKDKLIVDDNIKKIIKNPKIGEEKRGDLSGVFVHKFKVGKQEFLLAYEFSTKRIFLLALGVHENFYKKLKTYRKK